MSDPAAEFTTTERTAEATRPRIVASETLPTYRLNIMRVGYLFMGVGLALVK